MTKLYRQVIKTIEVLDKTVCNCCGEEIIGEVRDGDFHSWYTCTLRYSSTFDCPGRETVGGVTRDYDICAKCYENKLKPLFLAVPPNGWDG